jgi:hypothetical protein
LFLTLVSFAATVIATRIYLELTGYPRIGGGDLHIAHALIGGVLLFIASVLPIVLAGRAVYRTTAILSGSGIGLFIDEVGKFITAQNDYFYPAAAPIIYATFVLAALVWVRVRRAEHRDPRGGLLRALQLTEEAVDGDLHAAEKARLRALLDRAAQTAADEEQRRLARTLLHFLDSSELVVAPRSENLLRRLRRWWRPRRDLWLGGRGVRMLNVIAMFVLGAVALVDHAFAIGRMAGNIPETNTRLLSLETLHVAVDAIAGVLLVAGAVLINVRGRHRLGVTLAGYGLLVALALADLAAFYLRQFATIETALFHLALLSGLVANGRELRQERVSATLAERQPSPEAA